MDKDKQIKAIIDLLKFKPLTIKFDNIASYTYEDISEITDISHDLESLSISFNNQLHQNNDLEVQIIIENNEKDVVESDNIEIEDNIICIHLLEWRDRFFTDEEDEDNNHLKFVNENELIIKEEIESNIFDVNYNFFEDEEINISFKVEEPYPETPGR